ncbi:glycosyltransferase family 2 protein [Mesonia aquimarina]|uniref:glycosyltransferase family 2 protein n=1 Tax=Mesonia aquimarina TaxID=1504967 RepID=UPI000EF60F2A|nr:glycosyltransferase family 2 protein [Mesonia aquimarina]
MDYSVIIPVYNSEDSLKELSLRLISVFNSIKNISFELIFVDDFSSDNSWKILKEIKKKYPESVKIIRLSKNYGQHNATFCAFSFVKSDYIITIDDDLQHAPEDIVKLIDKIKIDSLDLVYGIDRNINNSIKNAGSQLWKKGSKAVEGALGEGSSFRIFNSSLVEKIRNHKQHFIFLDELFFWYTNYIDFVQVKKHPRKHGKTGYSLRNTFRFITSITLLYGTWPLKLMTYGGAFFSFLSFIIGLFFIFKKIFLGIDVAGFTAIIVAISFSTSLILLCFGIIGKYLNNIYIVLNNKPSFSIKERYL